MLVSVPILKVSGHILSFYAGFCPDSQGIGTHPFFLYRFLSRFSGYRDRTFLSLQVFVPILAVSVASYTNSSSNYHGRNRSKNCFTLCTTFPFQPTSVLSFISPMNDISSTFYLTFVVHNPDERHFFYLLFHFCRS